MLQVIKKKNVSFEIFKLSDEERTKEFEILFNITPIVAENLNKTFNIYAESYFKRMRVSRFFDTATSSTLDLAITNMSIINPNHVFLVNQYPSSTNILVNFELLTNLKMVDQKGIYQYDFRGKGQHYLYGGATKSDEIVLFRNPKQFIDDYLAQIKFPNSAENKYLRDFIDSLFTTSTPVFTAYPLKLTLNRKIPAAMLRIKDEQLVELTSFVHFSKADSTLLLDYVDFSEDILINEIDQSFDDDLFEKLRILQESRIYLDFNANLYELTAKILSISESYGPALLDRVSVRHFALIAYLIYLNIHDDILHLNPENQIVAAFKSGKKGDSLLDYYIEFMILLFKVLFKMDYTKGSSASKIVKNIYSSFVQTVRKRLEFQLGRGSLIVPPDFCGYYQKRLKVDLSGKVERDSFAVILKYHLSIINDRVDQVLYKMRDQHILTFAYMGYKIGKNIPYYKWKEVSAKELYSYPRVNEHDLPIDTHGYTGPPETKLPLPDIDGAIRRLTVKTGTAYDMTTLSNFGLLKKKMVRDEKHNPKEFDRVSYYKLGIQFIRTSIIELIYAPSRRSDISYPRVFTQLEQIDRLHVFEHAIVLIRALLFDLLSSYPTDIIIPFIKEQLDLYDKYEILDYDIEYTRQKRLEQYEKRNAVFFSLTPEEKLLLGIDDLHGEERSSLLDRLILEKET